MRSGAVRNVLLWSVAAMCAIAALVTAFRDNTSAATAMGAVALVFAVIAVAVRRGQARH